MWDDKGGQELIHAGDVVQSLKAKQKGLCSRFAVTLAAQEAAKFGRQRRVGGSSEKTGFLAQ